MCAPQLTTLSHTIIFPSAIALLKARAISRRPSSFEYRILACDPTTWARHTITQNTKPQHHPHTSRVEPVYVHTYIRTYVHQTLKGCLSEAASLSLAQTRSNNTRINCNTAAYTSTLQTLSVKAILQHAHKWLSSTGFSVQLSTAVASQVEEASHLQEDRYQVKHKVMRTAMYIHTYIHTYVHTYIHTYTCAYMLCTQNYVNRLCMYNTNMLKTSRNTSKNVIYILRYL